MLRPLLAAMFLAVVTAVAAYTARYRRSVRRRRAIPAPERLPILAELLRCVSDVAEEANLHPFLIYDQAARVSKTTVACPWQSVGLAALR
jgi:hypothetical protein